MQLVDVRWPNEWEAGRIEGAVHIPADYLFDEIETLDRARPVVAVCRSGDRSARVVAQFCDEGFDADGLEGGLLAWVAAGFTLVDAEGGRGRVVEGEPPVDERPAEMRQLEASYLDALFAVQEYFGDEEPADDQVRAFLRNRLIGEGRSPSEADRILDGPDP